MEIQKNIKGITLVALVITIIVLLILAGVTISLVLGKYGIFRIAQEASKNYTKVQEKEIEELDNFDHEVENTIGNLGNDPIGDGEIDEDKEINYIDDGEGNKIPVPKGFTHTEGTKDTGFVIKNKTDGNEFVWIPVTGMNYSYERFNFEGHAQNEDFSKFSEILPEDEKESIGTYGGYYIARYETGIEGYTSLTELENEEAPSESWTGYMGGKLVIQPGKQVWNYITRNKAIEIATSLYHKEKDNVQSKLCSSYAWDTTLKFMEQQGSSYPTNSEGGYYNQSAPSITGYDTTHPCNLYDMGGNVWEITTEGAVYPGAPYVLRGGGYNGEEKYHAAYRDVIPKKGASANKGFRITLFM